MYEYWINKQLVILWTEKDFSTELLSIRQFGKLTKQSNKNVIVIDINLIVCKKSLSIS